MAIAHVQSDGVQSVGAVASQAKAFPSANTAGNLLVVCVIAHNGPATFTLSDTLLQSYASAVRQTSGSAVVEIFYKAGCGAGANTVTVTPSVSAFTTFSVSEFSGAATSLPKDQSNSGAATDAAPTSGSITPGQDNELLVGAMLQDGNAATITEDTAAGWALLYENEGAANEPMSSEYLIQTTAAAKAATWALNLSRAWTAAVASFKAQAAAGSAPVAKSLLLRQSVVNAVSF